MYRTPASSFAEVFTMTIPLFAAIVCILALSGGPSGAVAFNTMRFPERGSAGAQFRLIHHTHPESPQYVPRLSPPERFRKELLSDRRREAVLSSRLTEAGVSSNSSSSSFIASLHTFQDFPYRYAMEISIGTPPQKLAVVADTGSSLVWVRCSPCTNCNVPSAPLFNSTASSTYSQMSCSDPLCAPYKKACNSTCQYEIRYGGNRGSIGNMSYETITLNTFGSAGSTKAVSHFAFGCGSSILGNLSKEAPPIAGLGMGPLSFTSQLGSLFGRKFSYCLVNYWDTSNITSPLLFGDAAVPNATTMYTPILRNPVENVWKYFIGLKGIDVDGLALDIPNGTFDINPNGSGGVISDSGTGASRLVPAAYSVLITRIQSVVPYPPINNPGSGFDLCYDLSNVGSPSLPKLTVVFEGFSLDLPDENAFVVVDGPNATCLAFAESTEDFSVWGNFQQQNFQILHDVEAMRFGYAKVQCDQLTV